MKSVHTGHPVCKSKRVFNKNKSYTCIENFFFSVKWLKIIFLSCKSAVMELFKRMCSKQQLNYNKKKYSCKLYLRGLSYLSFVVFFFLYFSFTLFLSLSRNSSNYPKTKHVSRLNPRDVGENEKILWENTTFSACTKYLFDLKLIEFCIDHNW